MSGRLTQYGDARPAIGHSDGSDPQNGGFPQDPPLSHSLQVSHGRFVFVFLLIGVTLATLRLPLTRPDWRDHVAPVCGWGDVALMFAAAAATPLGEATAISFPNPIFGTILTIPPLGDKVDKKRWLAAAISLIGAVILIRPGTEAVHLVRFCYLPNTRSTGQ